MPGLCADEAADAGVTISPQVQQNLGIRTGRGVKRAEMASSFDAVGAVQFDERLSVVVRPAAPATWNGSRCARADAARRQGAGARHGIRTRVAGRAQRIVALQRAGAARSCWSRR